jgi:hypothetical protein
MTALLVTVFLLSLLGCVTGTVKTAPQKIAPITSKESIVILAYRELEIETSAFTQTEEELVACLSTPIKSVYPDLYIVPPDEFRRIAFPDLRAEKAPTRPESLALLLDHSVFKERVAKLGLRYLIVVGALTKQPEPESWGGCALGMTGGGCLGVVVWDQESRMAASILDLREPVKPNELTETVTGNPWFAVIGVIPLAMPAPTESKACTDLGATIGKHLSAGQSSAP